jgi:hypothetical protein
MYKTKVLNTIYDPYTVFRSGLFLLAFSTCRLLNIIRLACDYSCNEPMRASTNQLGKPLSIDKKSTKGNGHV